MCGIAGIVLRNPHRPSPESVERMLSAIRHRGPDGAGVQSIGPSVVLGNVRLAVVDLSDNAAQPMSNDDGSVWITYNGEAYNSLELRRELEQLGRRFRSNSDTEVVLRLYEEFGDGFLSRLRGMFAFAIWDARSGQLLLARDRMGIKPLYIAQLPDGLIFASELRAFPASDLIPARWNPHAARIFLQLGHIPPPFTPFSGVEPLAPGEMAVWKDGELCRRLYWRLPLPPQSFPPESLASTVHSLQDTLVEAARLHRMSDVPMALFLSGGADSAAVAALMQAAGSQDLTALTIGFAGDGVERRFDESESSRSTARALGLRHRVLNLSAAEMAASLDRAIWALDQPSVDGLNTFWISGAAANAGFKVALSGQGGDEFFGGYISLPLFQRFGHIAKTLRLVPPSAGRILFHHAQFPVRWRKLALLVGADDPFVASQLAVRTLFLEDDIAQLLDPSLGRSDFGEARESIRSMTAEVAGLSQLEKIAYLDIRAHLQPRLLRDADAMSMAHSLELRPLLLDHSVVECALSLPARSRMNHKRLLLSALRGLMPEKLRSEIALRPKRTFTFPFSAWLSGPWRAAIQDAFDPSRLRVAGILQPGAVSRIWAEYQRSPQKIGWSRIWTLFVLQRWSEIMGVRP